MADQKEWWAPVWRGLVMDEQAVHFKKMGTAVWLYLYFLLHADRAAGFLKRKSRTISRDMGIKERTVRKWRSTLRRQGYIKTRQSSTYLNIEITKWKGVNRRQGCVTQGGPDEPVRAARSCQSEKVPEGRNHSHLSGEFTQTTSPNDISIKIDILNNDIDKGSHSISGHRAFKDFRPRNKHELLALDLADALHDRDNLPLYLSYAKRYPEQLLRSVLGEVKEIPIKKIKKSRGALFNHLVQKYAKQTDNNPRD
jgi:Helix-turn-helix domain